MPRVQTRAQRHNRRQEVTCEARAGLLYLQQSLRPARHGRDRVWGLVRCLWTPSSEASCLRLALYLALTGNDNPMYECMQAEARVLNLGRTSWHYDGGRRATAARPPQSRWCARVSDRVAGRAMPDFSKASPTPRMPAVLSRESSLEPRPVGTVPECVPPWRHTLSTRTVRPTGTCRAPATVAASWFRVRSEDGTTTALHRRPGKEGPAPVPRGTGGLPPSPGLSSDGWKAAP